MTQHAFDINDAFHDLLRITQELISFLNRESMCIEKGEGFPLHLAEQKETLSLEYGRIMKAFEKAYSPAQLSTTQKEALRISCGLLSKEIQRNLALLETERKRTDDHINRFQKILARKKTRPATAYTRKGVREQNQHFPSHLFKKL